MPLAGALVATLVATGAEVKYTGTSGSLADGNWSAPVTAADTLVVDGSTTTVPGNEFSLSGGLSANAFKVIGFSSPSFFDFTSGMPTFSEVTVTDDGGQNVQISGAVRDLSLLDIHGTGTANTGARVVLTNGDFSVNGRLKVGYSTLTVAKSATLSVSRIGSEDTGASDVGGNFIVDGGTMTVSCTDPKWNYSPFKLTTFGLQRFEVLNGGTFTDNGNTYLELTGWASSFRVLNRSTFSAVKATSQRGFTVGGNGGGVFAVSNSTFHCGNLMSGYFVDWVNFWHDRAQNVHSTPFTFHNSDVSLRNANAGFMDSGLVFFSDATSNNTVLVNGPDSRFDARNLFWGGFTNRFEVADGTYTIDKLVFLGGRANRVAFTGGTGTIGAIAGHHDGKTSLGDSQTWSGTNGLLSIRGTAQVTVSTSCDLSGSNLRMEIGDDAMLASGCGNGIRLSTPDSRVDISGGVVTNRGDTELFVLASENNVLDVTGGSVTGAVRFAGTNGRLQIGVGVHYVASPRAHTSSSLCFENGSSGNSVVISNGIFESAMFFGNGIVWLTEYPDKASNHEGVPFTGCPDSRIVFQGDHPRFLVTHNARFTGDAPYPSFTLGSSFDADKRHTLDVPPLDNPVRVKFCLPPNGYADAPIRVTVGRAMLGGNAEFEFDISDYEWPKRRTQIPLIYNSAKFEIFGTMYISVDGLNRTNAARLPVAPVGTKKASFRLSEDGTTLCLDVPGKDMCVIVFR